MAVKAPNPNHWTARELPDKLDFKIRTVKREKEGQYTMIKGLHHEELTNVKYLCTQQGAPKANITDFKGEIDSNSKSKEI